MAPRTKKNPDYTPPVTPENRVVDVSDIPEDRPESPELATVIERAGSLLEEKSELQVHIHECRMLGTMMTNNGIGSRDQVEWVRKYLPRKKRQTTENGDEE